jgi:hypothetical protein
MWEDTLDEIVVSVKSQMSIDAPVRAAFHNLLVYGDGGHFKLHKDSEKLPGMFGTRKYRVCVFFYSTFYFFHLSFFFHSFFGIPAPPPPKKKTVVVTLPSSHCGGKFSIHHQGEVVEFFGAGNNQLPSHANSNDLRWCAFHADCNHELERVTKGYRIALVYNLVRLPDAPKAETKEEGGKDLSMDWVAASLRPAAGTKVRIKGHVGLLEHAGSWNRLKGTETKVNGWQHGTVQVESSKEETKTEEDDKDQSTEASLAPRAPPHAEPLPPLTMAVVAAQEKKKEPLRQKHSLAFRAFAQRWLKHLENEKRAHNANGQNLPIFCCDKIMYTLSHQYTDQSHAWDKLKGSDDFFGRVLASCDLVDVFLCRVLSNLN